MDKPGVVIVTTPAPGGYSIMGPLLEIIPHHQVLYVKAQVDGGQLRVGVHLSGGTEASLVVDFKGRAAEDFLEQYLSPAVMTDSGGCLLNEWFADAREKAREKAKEAKG